MTENESTTIWFLMMKGCSDILGTFNYKKELLSAGTLSEGLISHLMNNPTHKSASEMFVVPSETRKMPASRKDHQILTLQGFIDLKVISRVTRRGNKIPDATKAKVIQLRQNGVSIRKIAAICDISKRSVENITKTA